MREEMRNKLSKHRDLSPRHTCGQVSLIFPFSFLIVNLFACAPEEPADQTPRFNVNKGSHAHGDFTISPARAAAGRTVTLTPTGNTGYVFSDWGFDNDETSATAAAGGKWTFSMPEGDVTVSATFVADPSAGWFNINKGTRTHGEIIIEGDILSGPERAVAGTLVTIRPVPDADYEWDSWTRTPNTLAITDAGNGTWTFTMPPQNVTIGARFYAKYGTATGVKTLTVKGGLGRTKGKSLGNDVYDGTRDITVTVTLANGRLTDVVVGHPIDARGQAVSNPFKDDADRLATGIKNNRDPDVPFVPTNRSGEAQAAWLVHEAAIRAAVVDAIDALIDGKPNRLVAGGGAQNFTADGADLSGDVTTVGSGHMTGMSKGGDHQGDSGFLCTDMTVHVALTAGRITTVTVDSDDQTCGWDGSKITTGLNSLWPNQIKANNDYINVDGISGATVYNSFKAMRGLIERAIGKMANEY